MLTRDETRPRPPPLHADHRGLRDGHVANPACAEFLEQPIEFPIGSAERPDILPQYEDTIVS